MTPQQLEAIVNVMKAADELTRRVLALEETLHKGPDPSAMAHSQGGIAPSPPRRPEPPPKPPVNRSFFLGEPPPTKPGPADTFDALVAAGELTADEAAPIRHKREMCARLESGPMPAEPADDGEPLDGPPNAEAYCGDAAEQAAIESARRAQFAAASKKLDGDGAPDKAGKVIGFGRHVSYSRESR